MSRKEYIGPEEAKSPKSRWRLHRVLHDGGAGAWSAAEGQWEHGGRWDDVLAVRWNGRAGDERGSPQSRGHPTWFIVPGELEAAVRAVIGGTGEAPAGGAAPELPAGSGADALVEEPVADSWVVETGQWEAWDTRRTPEDGDRYRPRRITEGHADRQECIAAAKRVPGIPPGGEFSRYMRIRHVGVDDDVLFREWAARTDPPGRCCQATARIDPPATLKTDPPGGRQWPPGAGWAGGSCSPLTEGGRSPTAVRGAAPRGPHRTCCSCCRSHVHVVFCLVLPAGAADSLRPARRFSRSRKLSPVIVST